MVASVHKRRPRWNRLRGRYPHATLKDGKGLDCNRRYHSKWHPRRRRFHHRFRTGKKAAVRPPEELDPKECAIRASNHRRQRYPDIACRSCYSHLVILETQPARIIAELETPKGQKERERAKQAAYRRGIRQCRSGRCWCRRRATSGCDKGKFDGVTESERNIMFDRCLEYDDHLRAEPDWRDSPVPLSAVCFRYVEGTGDLNALNRSILDRVIQRGRVYISNPKIGASFARALPHGSVFSQGEDRAQGGAIIGSTPNADRRVLA